MKSEYRPYQPKTGQKCGCKRGVQRDNCPNCEGTGWVIDFQAIRNRVKTEAEIKHTPVPWKADKWATGWTICAPGSHYSICHLEGCNNADANANFICRAVNSHADLLEACKEAAELVKLARQYFPKSIRDSATFTLENTNAALCKAIHQAGC